MVQQKLVSSEKINKDEVIHQEKLTPEIRFHNFDLDWSIHKLEDISTKIKTKNKNMEVITVFSNSAKYGIVLQEDFFDKDIANKINIDGYYIVHPNDFVYNPRISNHAPVGPIKRNNTGKIGIVSPLYSIFKIDNEINTDFIEQYFLSDKWHKYIRNVANYGARHDRMNITQKDLYGMPICIPKFEEQTKIADFLNKIDKKIELSEKNQALYEKQKDYYINFIFGEYLQNTDLNNFKLKKICEKIENGFSGQQVPYETKFPVTRIETISYGKINYDKVGFVEEIDEKYRLREGDILLTNINSLNRIGNVVIFEGEMPLYHGMNLMLLRPKKEFNSKYVYYYIYFNNRWFKKMACQAVNQSSINKSTIEKFSVLVPKAEIQDKIANLLTNIDNKIILSERNTLALNKFKRGLLQKMFV